MKTVLVFVMLMMGSSAFAYPQTCSCHELYRRASGLQFAADSAPTQPRERMRLRQASNHGFNVLNQSSRYPYHRQDSICTQGNVDVDYLWVRWQPWVARSGGDVGNPCE